MGFNYLQTDNRDDYFSNLSKPKKERRQKLYEISDEQGRPIASGNKNELLKAISLQFNLSSNKIRKGKWRKVLESNNYKLREYYEGGDKSQRTR